MTVSACQGPVTQDIARLPQKKKGAAKAMHCRGNPLLEEKGRNHISAHWFALWNWRQLVQWKQWRTGQRQEPSLRRRSIFGKSNMQGQERESRGATQQRPRTHLSLSDNAEKELKHLMAVTYGTRGLKKRQLSGRETKCSQHQPRAVWTQALIRKYSILTVRQQKTLIYRAYTIFVLFLNNRE